MAWVRLADDFADHPKIIAAGPLAGWLWVCGLAYCNRYLTDGLVPAGAVRRLVDVDEPARLAAKLVEVGLWERVADGFRVHDFRDYQPSAQAVREERDRNAERMREWRKRRHEPGTAGASHDATNGVTNAGSVLSPVPVPVKDPVPDPDPTSPPLPPSPHAGKGVHPNGRGRGDLTDVSDADRELWDAAREALRAEMSGPNWEHLVGPLVVLGRTDAGGLCLRAPPYSGAVRVRPAVAKALLDAGDERATHAQIIESEG